MKPRPARAPAGYEPWIEPCNPLDGVRSAIIPIAGTDPECEHCGGGYVVELEVICVRCDRPICPLCAVRLSVGPACPVCASEGER